eukprot:SAG31_NODE_754_length_12324_cov_3.930061_10_plen_68_part_00
MMEEEKCTSCTQVVPKTTQVLQQVLPVPVTTELKQRLVSHPVLRQPDPAKQFEIIGDACDYAIGSAV